MRSQDASTTSSIHGYAKEKLYKKLCSEKLGPLLDVFYNRESTTVQIEDAGIEILQYIYNSQGTPLSTLRVNRYNH